MFSAQKRSSTRFDHQTTKGFVPETQKRPRGAVGILSLVFNPKLQIPLSDPQRLRQDSGARKNFGRMRYSRFAVKGVQVNRPNSNAYCIQQPKLVQRAGFEPANPYGKG